VEENSGDFTVVLEAKDVYRSVKFSLAEHAIVVLDDKSTKILARRVANALSGHPLITEQLATTIEEPLARLVAFA
jgi:hypothetical protein